jgi:hypothetical protein
VLREAPAKTLVKTPGEMPRKTAEKILVLLRDDPRLAIPDLAVSIGKSESANVEAPPLDQLA